MGPQMTLTELRERVLARIEIQEESDCWFWAGSANPQGYGHLSLRGQTWQATHLSYLVWKGPVPDGKMVLHTCDTPRCVNPEHLFLGNHKDNAKDMAAKGRSAFQRRR